MRDQRGFSLIEIMVVTGTLALLSTIVIVAVSPAQQFARSRNAQRVAGLNFIASAIFQNIIDNNGNFVCSSGDFPSEESMISSISPAELGPTPPPAKSFLRIDLITPAYAAGELPQEIYNLAPCLIPMYTDQLPVDPNLDGAYWDSQFQYYSGYVIQKSGDGRITITAPGAELGQVISVTR